MFLISVSVTLILGVYGSVNLQLGPNSSVLITPNPLFVEYIKVTRQTLLSHQPCISLSFAVVFGVGSEFWLLIPGRAIRWGKYWAYSIWTLRGSTLRCCNYLVSNSQNLSPSRSSQGMSFHFVLGHVYKIQGNGGTINYSLFATGMDIRIKWRFSNKYFIQCELHEFIFSNSYNCPRYWKIFMELLPFLLSVIATNINYLLEGIYRSYKTVLILSFT